MCVCVTWRRTSEQQLVPMGLNSLLMRLLSCGGLDSRPDEIDSGFFLLFTKLF